MGNTHFGLYFKSEFVSEKRASERYFFLPQLSGTASSEGHSNLLWSFLIFCRIRPTSSPRFLQANTEPGSYDSLMFVQVAGVFYLVPGPVPRHWPLFLSLFGWLHFYLRSSVWLRTTFSIPQFWHMIFSEVTFIPPALFFLSVPSCLIWSSWMWLFGPFDLCFDILSCLICSCFLDLI